MFLFLDVSTDSKEIIQRPPPLSIDALMKFDNVKKAPGEGVFSHGKPVLYKL